MRVLNRRPPHPINQRRWRNFKANRRGWWSLWIFLILFVLSSGAEFLANDKPLLVYFEGRFYFPVLRVTPETAFGGDFPTETDYRDPFVQALIEVDGWMVWPPIRFSYDTINWQLDAPAPSPPTVENWLGTDDLGRDVAARLVYGFRISVLFGLALTVASTLVGVAAGAVQGFYGGRIDIVGQRFIEIWQGLPVLFLLIILSSFVQPNFWWLLSIMLLFSWMSLVDVVRAEFLRGRNLDYVRAARTLGAGDLTIMV
ncbi:MAG: ABC transporter permease, partial [Desulfosarcina sp.]